MYRKSHFSRLTDLQSVGIEYSPSTVDRKFYEFENKYGAFSPCDGSGLVTFRCEDCRVSGRIRTPCSRCDGDGHYIKSGICRKCEGSGHFAAGYCWRCNGTGIFESSTPSYCYGCKGVGYIDRICPNCSGKCIVSTPCRKCNGNGRKCRELIAELRENYFKKQIKPKISHKDLPGTAGPPEREDIRQKAMECKQDHASIEAGTLLGHLTAVLKDFFLRFR